PIGMVFPYGGPEPRHPSQLYEAVLEGLVLTTVMFLLARNPRVRNRPGILSAVFLAGYGISRIIVEFFREPDVQIGYIAGMFTMGQILCLPMLIGAAVLVYVSGRNKERPVHDAA
ncbi:MAG TPA: prolipoprotein diacylglyceryl transferase, partial [Micavibrio sp.]